MTQQDLTTAFAGLSSPEDVFASAIEVFREFGEGWLAHGVIDPIAWTLCAFTTNLPQPFLADLESADLKQNDYASHHLAKRDDLMTAFLADPDTPDRAVLNTILRRFDVSVFICQPVPVEGAAGGVTFCALSDKAAVQFRDENVRERYTLAALLFNAAFQHGSTAMRPTAGSPLRKNFLLSPREYEALTHAAHGLMIDAIADQMGVSVPAVKKFLALARGKLGAKTQAQAIAIAVSRKMITV